MPRDPVQPQDRCNPERIKKICDAIKTGSCFKWACASALISDSAAKRWLDMGEQDAYLDISTSHRDFYEAVKKAEADLEHRLTERWVKALEFDDDGWKGIENYLSKRFKDDWGKSPVEIHQSVTDLRKTPEFNEIIKLIMEYVPDDKQVELSDKLNKLMEKDAPDLLPIPPEVLNDNCE